MKYEMNVKDIRTEALLQGEQIGLQKGLIEGRSQGLAEGHSQGLAEGHSQGLAEGTVIGMLKAGATYDFIAKATAYSIDKIKEIAKQQKLI